MPQKQHEQQLHARPTPGSSLSTTPMPAGNLPQHLREPSPSGSHSVSTVSMPPSREGGGGSSVSTMMRSPRQDGKMIMVPAQQFMGKKMMMMMPQPARRVSSGARENEFVSTTHPMNRMHAPMNSIHPMGKTPMMMMMMAATGGPQQAAVRPDTSRSTSATFSAGPPAPLQQYAKKQPQGATMIATNQSASFLPYSQRGMHESQAGFPHLFAQSVGSDASRLHVASGQVHPQETLRGGAAQPQAQLTPQGRRNSNDEMQKRMMAAMMQAGNRQKVEQEPVSGRAPPQARYAKGGVPQRERRQGQNVAATPTAAAANTSIQSGRSADGHSESQSPQKVFPQQQQVQQQISQPSPRKPSSTTSLGGDGRRVSENSAGLVRAFPVPVRAAAPQVAPTKNPATKTRLANQPSRVDYETAAPLVVPPSVHLRDEAGEAGIAPSSVVQATRDGEENQRQSEATRRVLRFPSLAIVDSDEDSSASSKKKETFPKPQSTTQGTLIAPAQGARSTKEKTGQQEPSSPMGAATINLNKESTPKEKETSAIAENPMGIHVREVSNAPAVFGDSMSALGLSPLTNTLTREGTEKLSRDVTPTPTASPHVEQLNMKQNDDKKAAKTLETSPCITPPMRSEANVHPRREEESPTRALLSFSPLPSQLATSTSSSESTLLLEPQERGENFKKTEKHERSQHRPASAEPSAQSFPRSKTRAAARGPEDDVRRHQQHSKQQRRDTVPPTSNNSPTKGIGGRGGSSNSLNEERPHRVSHVATSVETHKKRGRNHRDEKTNTNSGGIRKEEEEKREHPHRSRSRSTSSSRHSMHSSIFHIRDVYQLYKELKRQKSRIQRKRFSRWRKEDSKHTDKDNVDDGDRSRSRISARRTKQHKASSQRPWRSCTFHPDPPPPPSPIRRPLGYIQERDGYRSVYRRRGGGGGGEYNSEDGVNGAYTSSMQQCSPCRSVSLSRLSHHSPYAAIAATSSPQRRRWYPRRESCEFSYLHPYEVIPFFKSPRNEKYYKKREAIHENTCDYGNISSMHNNRERDQTTTARASNILDERKRRGGSRNSIITGGSGGSIHHGNGKQHRERINDPAMMHSSHSDKNNDKMTRSHSQPAHVEWKQTKHYISPTPPQKSSLLSSPLSDLTTTRSPQQAQEGKLRRSTTSTTTTSNNNYYYNDYNMMLTAPGGIVSPSPGRSPTHAVVKDLTVKQLRRCCSEGNMGGTHFRTTGGSTNTGSWLDEVMAVTLGGERSSRAVARARLGRVPIPVVDLRKDFRPRLDSSLESRNVLSTHNNNNNGRSGVKSNKSAINGRRTISPVSQGNINNNNNQKNSMENSKATTMTATTTSNSPCKRRVLNVPLFSSSKPPSSFTIKDPDKPSAWAMGPERRNLLAASPTARRRIVRRAHEEEERGRRVGGNAFGTHGRSSAAAAAAGNDKINKDSPRRHHRGGGGGVVLVEEVRLDEQRRPYVLIREIPFGVAAVEAQRDSVKRLSTPRPAYVHRHVESGE